ncbi:MAG: glutamate formimidoyltransferase [Candidatus Neomarinimicrobiota bacterium]
MNTLVECVPNFSEGNDQTVIDRITQSIGEVDGATVLDVDPGKDTNRTVVTFVGSIEAVEEGAFQGIKTAAQVIDMRKHNGTHPRMGATDVCPFIPVSGVDIEDCISLSERVADRVGKELEIPVFLYEYSAKSPERKNLAKIREGEYEGLSEKLNDPNWKPDYGPARFHPQAGATVMGARDFLIAYNINLNTKDKRIATDIAFELREKGRSLRLPSSDSSNLLDGEIIRYQKNLYTCSQCDKRFKSVKKLIIHSKNDHDTDLLKLFDEYKYDLDDLVGKAVKKPGLYKDIKAIGWYLDSYNRAQISINFTNYKHSSIHDVFDSTRSLALERGVRVTGSELVGLIPLEALVVTGKHYLEKQGKTAGVPEKELVECAIQSLGLNDVTPFNPVEKIIDYAVRMPGGNLTGMKMEEFINELSTNSPAPGGGSVSALASGLGAALSSMVAALTHEKKGKSDKKSEMALQGMIAQELKDRLILLVDEDTAAFNKVIEVNRLPSATKKEKKIKSESILKANKYAINVPLEVASLSLKVMEQARYLVENGNLNSVSDAGVAGEVAYAGLRGACLNVLINLSEISAVDMEFAEKVRKQIDDILKRAQPLHKTIFRMTNDIIHKNI